MLLNIDFLRSDYVGPQNGSTLTPNIDNFFRDGLVFKNIYSPSGSTYRGNLSVFTATNPFFYNLDVKTFESLRSQPGFRYWKEIYTSQKTLAEYMKSAGYHTAMLNKGTRSGKATMLDRGYDSYKQFPMRILIEDQIKDLFTQIENIQEPYFIHFHAIPTRLHRAYYPQHRQRVKDKHIIYAPYNLGDDPYGYKVIRNHGATKYHQRRAEHTIYRQQLEYADEQLKRIFDFISNRLENTVVILTSTHGTQIGDKDIYASNGVSYESNIRVPLMIKIPGKKFNSTIDDRLSLLGLVPGILKLVGLPHDTMDGMNLLSVLDGKQDYTRPFIAGHNDKDSYLIQGDWKLFVRSVTHRTLFKLQDGMASGNDIYRKKRMTALNIESSVNHGFDLNIERKTENYLFIKKKQEIPELYNLREDPLEERNLVKKYPAKSEELLKLLHHYRQQAKNKIDSLNLEQADAR